MRRRVKNPHGGPRRRLMIPYLRVADWEADEAEAALDDYLDAIIEWHPAYSHHTGATALASIARNKWQCGTGQTIIERVVVIHRYAMDQRRRREQMNEAARPHLIAGIRA
jgi:hypothetical protein